MKKQTKPLKKQLILITITLVILLFLGNLVEWGALGERLQQAKLFPLFAALAVTLPFPLLNTLRWYSVLRAVKAPVTIKQAFKITMACWPIGVLTPGKAGEFLKIKVVPSKSLGLGTVYAERVIDLFTLGIFGVVFGTITAAWWAVIGGLAGMGASVGVVVTGKIIVKALKGKPIAEKIQGLLEVLPILIKQPRLFAACILSSSMNWWLSMVQMYFLLEAFGEPTPLLFLMAIVPGATFAGLIPLTIAGVGTRDAAFLALGSGRIDEAALLASAIFYSLFGYFLLGCLGLPFLGALTRKDQISKSKKDDL